MDLSKRHFIQNKILQVLIYTDSARYSELKPREIESNLFIYHLKQLIKEGLVTKNASGRYSLSPKGKAYADKISFSSLKVRSQPKIVNLIACFNKDGQALLYKRKNQPFIGLSGFPHGKIHLGETIIQSSERELLEKTNLKAKLKHRGDVYVTVFDGDTLISHILFHVHTASDWKGELRDESQYGMCYWSDIDMSNASQYFPGFLDIYKQLLANPKHRFFDELVFHI